MFCLQYLATSLYSHCSKVDIIHSMVPTFQSSCHRRQPILYASLQLIICAKMLSSYPAFHVRIEMEIRRSQVRAVWSVIKLQEPLYCSCPCHEVGQYLMTKMWEPFSGGLMNRLKSYLQVERIGWNHPSLMWKLESWYQAKKNVHFGAVTLQRSSW